MSDPVIPDGGDPANPDGNDPIIQEDPIIPSDPTSILFVKLENGNLMRYPFPFKGTIEKFLQMCIETFSATDVGIAENFIPELEGCYRMNTGVVSLDLDSVKEWKKTKIRQARILLLQQLDVLYSIEAEKIYETGIFQKTPEMDEIFRKKRILRDLPARIDPLVTVQEVIDFAIPSSLSDVIFSV